MLEEKNAFGQTPLHLASDRPAVLKPLLAAAGQRHLDERDNWGQTAIDVAVSMSGDNCASKSDKESQCKKCHCSQTMVMLLRAGCAITTPFHELQALLKRASLRCKKRFIKGMKDRRERLKRFAHRHLPKSTITMLMVDDECVLDFKALAVFQALLARGLDPPSELSLGLDLDPWREKDWGSVYHYIRDSRDADIFFAHGFRDMDSICDEGFWESIHTYFLSRTDLTYSMWLIHHGANLFKPLPQPNGRKLESARTNAYYLLHNIFLSPEHYSALSLEFEHSLHSLILSYDIVDDCQCGCSEQGCTPFAAMLNLGDYCYENPRSMATIFTKYVRAFSKSLSSTQYREALRYYTFMALDIQHTCVCFYEGIHRIPPYDDLQHMRDEQSDILQLMESLMQEFGDRLEQVLADPGCSADDICLFWEGYWADRMEEEVEALAADDISDEQRLAAERMGVVWNGPGGRVERGWGSRATVDEEYEMWLVKAVDRLTEMVNEEN